MLKVCLNSAVEKRLILRNPADGCKLPKEVHICVDIGCSTEI